MNETYKRIKELCDSNNIKFSRLCEEITGSLGNTPTWNKGNIRNEHLVQIANRFKVTTDYLLGKSNIPNLEAAEDDEVMELRQQLAERPEMKTLFSLTKYASKQKVESINNMLQQFRDESGHGDYDDPA